MALTKPERTKKLQELAESEGYDSIDDLLCAAAFDCIAPSICTAPGCDYTTEMEPDQDRGYCEVCGGQTVQSCLVLAQLL